MRRLILLLALVACNQARHPEIDVIPTAGKKGDNGPAGSKGDPGPAGQPAPPGQGQMGPAGPQGTPGLPGQPGGSGPMGPTGPMGPIGPAGSGGGSPGPAGPMGPMGPSGPKGDAGSPGSPGHDGHDGQNGHDGQPGAGNDPDMTMCVYTQGTIKTITYKMSVFVSTVYGHHYCYEAGACGSSLHCVEISANLVPQPDGTIYFGTGGNRIEMIP